MGNTRKQNKFLPFTIFSRTFPNSLISLFVSLRTKMFSKNMLVVPGILMLFSLTPSRATQCKTEYYLCGNCVQQFRGTKEVRNKALIQHMIKYHGVKQDSLYLDNGDLVYWEGCFQEFNQNLCSGGV